MYLAVDRVSAITKEDLEFSVGSKQAVWEVKDPLLPVSLSPRTPQNSVLTRQVNPEYAEDDSQSAFRGAGGSLVGGYGGNSYYQNYTGPAAQYAQQQQQYGSGYSNGSGNNGQGQYAGHY